MKNNKGFSMIELIVSFSITTVIVVMLLQIVLVLKDVYTKSSIKTSILNKQNIIVNLIYTDILEYGLESVSTCTNSDNCVKFEFANGNEKELSYNNENKIISYGDYTTELVGGSKVTGISINNNNNVISVSLSIKHNLFSKDFVIRIVHYLHEKGK